MEIAGRYNKTELVEISKALSSLTREMEAEPFEDLLGAYYQEIASKATRDNRAEFYTPPSISELMANICIDADAVITQ